MPRHRRWFFPGLSLHVIQRGNNRGDIFQSNDDRQVWLWALRNACDLFGLEVHAYVLMTNHVHLVTTPSTECSLPKVMQFVGRHYVPYFNRRYSRTGGLFDGRYRASHIHTEQYWYNAVRYVELNPVRAGIVLDPAEYHWSSYRTHAFGDENPIVAPHSCYQRLGATAAECQLAWRTACATPLSDQQLWEIRKAAAVPSTLPRQEPTPPPTP
jgi:putative transposase